jgi:preprotein translocase subunit SecB
MTNIDRTHRAGLNFDWVITRELLFEDDPQSQDHVKLAGLQASVDLKTWVSDDQRQCRTYLRVTLTPNAEGPKPFLRLIAAVEGQFSAEDEKPSSVPVTVFVKTQAPAILFPFVRQAIAAVTAGSRFGQLLLPPINVVALVSGAELEKASSQAR